MGHPDGGSTDGSTKPCLRLGFHDAANQHDSITTFDTSSFREHSTSHTARAYTHYRNIAYTTGPSISDTASYRVEPPCVFPCACLTRVGTRRTQEDAGGRYAGKIVLFVTHHENSVIGMVCFLWQIIQS